MFYFNCYEKHASCHNILLGKHKSFNNSKPLYLRNSVEGLGYNHGNTQLMVRDYRSQTAIFWEEQLNSVGCKHVIKVCEFLPKSKKIQALNFNAYFKIEWWTIWKLQFSELWCQYPSLFPSLTNFTLFLSEYCLLCVCLILLIHDLLVRCAIEFNKGIFYLLYKGWTFFSSALHAFLLGSLKLQN